MVRRRFSRSMINFFTLYAPLADEWTMFDNSAPPQAQIMAAAFGVTASLIKPETKP
jgi:predicted ABC-type ATPase